jgi:hypothetical protein
MGESRDNPENGRESLDDENDENGLISRTRTNGETHPHLDA